MSTARRVWPIFPRVEFRAIVLGSSCCCRTIIMALTCHRRCRIEVSGLVSAYRGYPLINRAVARCNKSHPSWQCPLRHWAAPSVLTQTCTFRKRTLFRYEVTAGSKFTQPLGLAPGCVIICWITFARGSSAMSIGHLTIGKNSWAATTRMLCGCQLIEAQTSWF